MDGGAAVGLGHLIVVHFAEPIVGGDGTGIGQNQAAHGIGDGGVFLHAPVVDLQIIVYQVFIVHQGGIDVAHLFPLLAVQDVGLGHVGIAGFGQHLFHAVLNILHGDFPIMDLAFKIGGHMQGQQLDHAGMILPAAGVKRLRNGRRDLADGEVHHFPVPFHNLVHKKIPFRG